MTKGTPFKESTDIELFGGVFQNDMYSIVPVHISTHSLHV